jgi:hypothetical protein
MCELGAGRLAASHRLSAPEAAQRLARAIHITKDLIESSIVAHRLQIAVPIAAGMPFQILYFLVDPMCARPCPSQGKVKSADGEAALFLGFSFLMDWRGTARGAPLQLAAKLLGRPPVPAHNILVTRG